MDIIATYPSVIYKVTMNDGTLKQIDNPVFMPDPSHIAKIEEPMVKAFVICPNESIGDMMALISEKRGAVGPHGNVGRPARDAHEPAAVERNPD